MRQSTVLQRAGAGGNSRNGGNGDNMVVRNDAKERRGE